MLFESEFWVAVAFAILVGIVILADVPALLARALDARICRMKVELDEARRLHEEARDLFEQYRRMQSDAENEADLIIKGAKLEGDHLRAQAERTLNEFVARQTILAEAGIGQAEARASAEVRATAADAAVAAAEKILSQRAKGETGGELIAQAIKEISARPAGADIPRRDERAARTMEQD